MSEQSNNIKGRCACGEYHWDTESFAPGRWSDRYRSVDYSYCPYCGYYLADNGIANRMVRAEELAVRERALERAHKLIPILVRYDEEAADESINRQILNS